MAELELLQKIATDIAHIKGDLEEIRELVYPQEERIRPEFVESVNAAEAEHRKGTSHTIKASDVRRHLQHL